jgi:hypothetical protein
VRREGRRSPPSARAFASRQGVSLIVKRGHVPSFQQKNQASQYSEQSDGFATAEAFMEG